MDPKEEEIVEVQRLIRYRGPKWWVRNTLRNGYLAPIGNFEPSANQRISSEVGGHAVAKEAAEEWRRAKADRNANDFVLEQTTGLPDES